MFKLDQTQIVAALLAFGLLAGTPGSGAAAIRIEGQVQASGAPLANSTVTLWQANDGAPRQLAQTKAGSDGRFEVNSQENPGADAILYLVSKGGAAASGSENAANAMLLVLSSAPLPNVVINELTTVASVFTTARFIKGESISGNPLGLRIAAGNVPNLVDPVTGSWGKVLLDPINITQSTTLANLNTLGDLLAAFTRVANNDWRDRFLKAATPIDGATPKNTVEAIAAIARAPCVNAFLGHQLPKPAHSSFFNRPSNFSVAFQVELQRPFGDHLNRHFSFSYAAILSVPVPPVLAAACACNPRCRAHRARQPRGKSRSRI
jgi:hypothetical protein